MTMMMLPCRRRAVLVLLLVTLVVALAAPVTHAKDAFPVTPEPTTAVVPPMVAEDANFDPYQENVNVAPMLEPVSKSLTPEELRELQEQLLALQQKDKTYEPKGRKVEVFDFDPSEGLTFFIAAGQRECFFQDAKTTGDEISGAYVVSSADSHIDLEVRRVLYVVFRGLLCSQCCCVSLTCR